MTHKQRGVLSAWVLAVLFLFAVLPVMAQEADLPQSGKLSAVADTVLEGGAPPAATQPPDAAAEPPGENMPEEPPKAPLSPATGGDEALPAAKPPPVVEPSPDTENVETVPPMMPEASQADTVATWDELARWMAAHQNDGGTVHLTAPIVFEKGIAGYWFHSATTLDLGAYGLTVQGELELYSPHLTIKGNGGENASVRALPGGYVSVTADAVQEGPNGPVLWQDGGGILLSTLSREDGAVHYAEQPVAYAVKPIVAQVRPGQTAGEALPDTVTAEVVFEGSLDEGRQLPVVWDMSGEEATDAIANRRRAKVPGRFDGAYAYGPLDCTLVFLNQPITFGEAAAEKNRSFGMVYAEFTYPSLPPAVEAECSFDGKAWFTANAVFSQRSGGGSLMLTFCHPDTADEEDVAWDTAQHPLLYLRLFRADAPSFEEAYSDVLTVDGDTLGITSDIGGNRGGGTGLGTPGLPPVANGENAVGGIGGSIDDDWGSGADSLPDKHILRGKTADESKESILSGETADAAPPVQPERHGAASIAQVPQSATAQPSVIPSIESGDSFGESLSIPPSNQSNLRTAPLKAKKPVKTHLGEVFTASKSTLQGMTDTSLLHVPVDAVASRARTTARTAAGVLATGGLIALTMTWKSWGSAILRILRILTTKKT